jgi:CubicO group peptidase (beta-lactamase class C family)
MLPRIAATALVLFLVGVPAGAQTTLVYEVFGAYFDSLRQQAGIPGAALAVVGRDRILWERAYGAQDVDRFIAARTDTPFNADGLTQTITAVMSLQCADERRLALDDTIGDFRVDTSEPDATIHQLLTHTSGAPGRLSFAYRPERLAPLWRILRTCKVDSYRESFARLLRQLGMFDSVPGANIVTVTRGEEGVPTPDDVARYTAVLERRATPYAIDGRGRATAARYPDGAFALTPASGLVTTVRDLAKFDLALKEGLLVTPGTLAAAWSAPGDVSGAPLPHATGWFVQQFGGEQVVWQFGMTEDTSSSLMITLPARGLTLIVMANSDRLVRQYSPKDGDITLSPFARLFLNTFVR